MNGLILAGGNSSRMGSDKATLPYGGKPQYLRLKELLDQFCDHVYLSCSPDSAHHFEGIDCIADLDGVSANGPVSGLLSAFTTYQGVEWVVLACDYPLISADDIHRLIENRDYARVATVFRNPDDGLPEPLIGIYESQASPALKSWFGNGNTSLRKFLLRYEARLVAPLKAEAVTSVDTSEQYFQIKNKYQL